MVFQEKIIKNLEKNIKTHIMSNRVLHAIYNDDDILLFSELCGMVAAKNIVEDNELISLLSDLSINELEALINVVKNRKK
jgi:hypothetical protein